MANVASDLTPSAFDLPSSNPATLVNITGTNFPVAALSFAGSAAGNLAYVKLTSVFYGGGTLSLRLNWYSAAGSTSGSVTWAAAIAPTSAGSSTSVEALAFNTAASVSTAVNANSKGDTLTTITISDVTNLTNGGIFWLRVTRTDSSMAGAAILTKADITWQDGAGGATGGDVVGPSSATNNAVALYDLTSGKLLKNSVVAVDGSGNVSGVSTLNAIDPFDWVRGPSPATATDNAIVRWDNSGIDGRQVKNSPVTIADTTGNMSGVGTLNGRTISNWVDGPASATDGRVAVWDLATGKLLKNGTKLEADLVVGPASSTGGNVPTFNGTGGKTLQDSGVAITSLPTISGTPVAGRMAGWSTSGSLGAASIDTANVVANTSGTGVVVGELAQFVTSTSGTRINGGGAGSKLLQNVVTNTSGSATIGRIAIMNSSNGTEIGEGAILATSIVTGPATATSGNFATYNGGTGKIIQDSGVATTEVVRTFRAYMAATNATSGTGLTNLTNLTITFPSSGVYVFEYVIFCSVGATATIGFATAITGTPTNISVSYIMPLTTTTQVHSARITSSGVVGTTGSRSVTTVLAVRISGSFNAAAGGTIIPMAQASASALTAQIGSWGIASKL